MKYFILTITFLLAVILITMGILFYTSYKVWLKNKPDIIKRLEDLKVKIESESGRNLSLSPELKESEPNIIYDRNNEIIGVFSRGRRTIVKLKDISPILIKTLLTMEDRRFYQHHGIDYRAILSAIYYNIKSLSIVRGGSTITQQLAKILFTDRKKNLKRKMYELFCTFEIEKRFTKDEILTLYLNSIYFGHFIYGIYNASLYYFNKEPLMLDLYESSLLVGVIPNPTRFSPLLHPDRAIKRMKLVLSVVKSMGFFRSENIKKGIEKFWERFRSEDHYPVLTMLGVEKNRAPYFVEYIRGLLKDKYEIDLYKTNGLKVYTTADLDIQRLALKVLREGLSIQASKLGDKIMDLGVKPEGAIVSINPISGEIYALVGGSGYSYLNQFNRAVSAKRQVGSAFKPFVFAAAIEYNGFTPDTKIVDKPLKIKTKSGIWMPRNYNNKYYGRVTLEFALKKSLNSVAVQLLQTVGPEKVISLVSKALDLDEEEASNRFKPYLSLALGAFSFTPLELACAYSIFPDGGERLTIYGIRKIEDAKGRILVDNVEKIKKDKVIYDIEGDLSVISPKTAENINQMLEKVLMPGGTAYWAVKSTGLEIKACGKTGTTNRYTDAWFVGYTRDILSVVWVGFDNPEYSLGKGQAGGVVAAPIWAELMKNIFWRN